MAEPMKIRAQLKGDIADIRVLMSHPMETGLVKDAKTGQITPPHYIQEAQISVNGKIVVDGQIGTSVSRNPVFGFKLKGARTGDKVVVSWVDNQGERRSDAALIL